MAKEASQGLCHAVCGREEIPVPKHVQQVLASPELQPSAGFLLCWATLPVLTARGRLSCCLSERELRELQHSCLTAASASCS